MRPSDVDLVALREVADAAMAWEAADAACVRNMDDAKDEALALAEFRARSKALQTCAALRVKRGGSEGMTDRTVRLERILERMEAKGAFDDDLPDGFAGGRPKPKGGPT